MKKSKPLVSIAIPTLNSGKTLENTLLSIKNQTYKKVEIIISDGHSKDSTLEIAKKYKAKVCYGKTLALARYNALKISSGKYLFALDSDQFIGSTLIERAVKKMENENCDALILHEKSIVRKGTFIEKLLALDKKTVVDSRDSDPLFGAEIPRFFDRKKLLSLKWPKKVSILDDAILYKDNLLNLSVKRLSGDGIKHYEVQSFIVFFKKFMRYGKLYRGTMSTSKSTTFAHSLPRRSYFSKEIVTKPSIFAQLFLLYLLKAAAVTTGIIVYSVLGKQK